MPANDKTTSLNMYDGDLLFWIYEGREYCLHVMADTQPDDPRAEDDCRLTTLACFHRRHRLGDSTGFSAPIDFVRDLLDKYAEKETIARFVREGKFPENIMAAIAEQILIDVPGGCEMPGVEDLPKLSDDTLRSGFLDAVIENDLFSTAFQVLEDAVVQLPVWLYDHSGLTISAGERSYPYNDQWDSSQLGWIVATKDDILENCMCPESEWKAKALEIMQNDIAVYDDYLTGNVYWYQIYSRPAAEKDDDGEETTEDSWTDEDSCSGFYGSDVFKNGILDMVDHGCQEAVESGTYETGKAESRVSVNYVFRKD